jgi:phosphoglycerol transferase MdoB-like AlkP superfamily enzyme
VYSPLLHLVRNIEYGKRLDVVLKKDAAHFERRNHFKGVTLAKRPTIVVICVESYGSVVYRDPEHSAAVAGLVTSYEQRLRDSGYRFASTHSDAPIFAGGSWLSYASLTYGIEFTEPQLFDALFAAKSPFGAYESLFHVLKRNGYRNVLLCPLAGVDTRNVDWGQIDRFFQSDVDITFDSLGYRGPLVNYFGVVRLYSPLDQYSLSHGYERAAREASGPFSLFFCTLNSHYPWESVGEVVADWRSLDDPAAPLHSCRGGATERYRAAIRYQLDYVLRFVHERADDDVVFVVFGDHQPPLITEKRMGKQTPIHVIARNAQLIDVFLEHGFAAGLDLTGAEPRPIRHQGFLSLFLKGMQAAYGVADVPVDYRADGVALFDERTTV